jgi:hypothetical protein
MLNVAHHDNVSDFTERVYTMARREIDDEDKAWEVTVMDGLEDERWRLLLQAGVYLRLWEWIAIFQGRFNQQFEHVVAISDGFLIGIAVRRWRVDAAGPLWKRDQKRVIYF